MNEQVEMVNYDGLEMPKVDAERLNRWLISEDGTFFWKYMKQRKQDLHDSVCHEIGDSAIKDLLIRERLIGREMECAEIAEFRLEFIEYFKRYLTSV